MTKIIDASLKLKIWKDTHGQDLVEYALVVGLISVAAVATLKGAATAINGLLTSITTTLNNA